MLIIKYRKIFKIFFKYKILQNLKNFKILFKNYRMRFQNFRIFQNSLIREILGENVNFLNISITNYNITTNISITNYF